MRSLLLTLASTAWFVAPAFSQVLTFSTPLKTEATASAVTITIDLSSGPMVRAMTGAPYSGRPTSRSVQILADGTRLTRESSLYGMTYRDSMGRVRTERPAFPVLSGIRPIAEFTIIEITDPVAGYRYLLDSVNHVAHRAPFQGQVIRATPALPASAPPPSQRTMPDGTVTASEPLGTDSISGVTVVGRRTTFTYPAGSRMGNDRPVARVSENWMSPQLGISLRSKSTGPEGESTMTMEDFSATEPDPSLFLIPSGYQIVDETGPFKIVVPRETDAR